MGDPGDRGGLESAQGLETLSDARPFDTMIGRLDRLLSEFLIYAEDPGLDEADRQTIKHHSDDLIGVGQAALKKIANKP